jgi:hypothetical protein
MTSADATVLVLGSTGSLMLSPEPQTGGPSPTLNP